MRVFFIGFGQAGGKIVDMFIEQDKKLGTNSFRGIAVNTARTDLMGLKNVDMKDRILIGQTMLKGHGVGTDNVTGARVTADEIDSIISAIDIRGTHDVDAFVIVAGLGGGTGSGGSPVLARHLKRIYREPVYALGIIPSPEEGRLYSYNAARSLTTLVNECDNTFIFDNSAWKNEGESVKSAFQRLNNEVVRRFGVLFRAGEVSKKMGVGEMVVDSSEIINTLRGGGITSVGYAISEVISKHTKKQRGIIRNLKDKIRWKAGRQTKKSFSVRISLQKLLLLYAGLCSDGSPFPVITLQQREPLFCSRVHRMKWIARVLRKRRAGLKRT